MTQGALNERRLRRVEDVFADLPARYLGAEDGFDATYQVVIGDVGRRWEVRTTDTRCVVRRAPTRRANAVIGTDSETFLAMHAGRLSSAEAYSQRLAHARGDIDLALGFEGLFRLPNDRPPLVRVHDVRIKEACLSVLTAGSGERHVILLHGLGGSKLSFLETIAALARDYRVHAIDLPGFGSSSKPARGAYDAPWFARAVLGFMDALAIDRAHLVGNSMGGRVALELALARPGRVRSLGLLAPALAFRRRRGFVPIVRLLRPELAAIPHPMLSRTVRSTLAGLFADPGRLDPASADVAVNEFLRGYRSRNGRIAFAAAARNIYLDPPDGDRGFYARLARLERPSLFVWGEQDTLVPPAFSRHVEQALPGANQHILPDCGHVPQIERADLTNALLRELFTGADLLGTGRPALRRVA